jgi:hypothetical protein
LYAGSPGCASFSIDIPSSKKYASGCERIIGGFMLTLDAILKIPEYVVFSFVDQDAILLNTRSNEYYALDEVGARFWGLLRDGKSLKDGYKVLQDEYEVAPEQLEKDLLDLIGELVDNGLVEIIQE